MGYTFISVNPIKFSVTNYALTGTYLTSIKLFAEVIGEQSAWLWLVYRIVEWRLGYHVVQPPAQAGIHRIRSNKYVFMLNNWNIFLSLHFSIFRLRCLVKQTKLSCVQSRPLISLKCMQFKLVTSSMAKENVDVLCWITAP